MTEEYIIQIPPELIKEMNRSTHIILAHLEEIRRRREPEPYPFTHPIREVPNYSKVKK